MCRVVPGSWSRLGIFRPVATWKMSLTLSQPQVQPRLAPVRAGGYGMHSLLIWHPPGLSVRLLVRLTCICACIPSPGRLTLL